MIGTLPLGQYALQVPSGPIPSNTPGYITASDMGAGDGIVRDAYEPGNLIRLTARVFELGGTMIDPDTLILRTIDPNGQVTTYNLPDLTRQALGLYTLDIQANLPRTWDYTVETTGPVANTGSLEFYILPPAPL